MKELQERLAELLGEEGYESGTTRRARSFPAEKYSLRWLHRTPKPIPELLEIAEGRLVALGFSMTIRTSKFYPRYAVEWHGWEESSRRHWRVHVHSTDTELEARMACAIKALERLKEEANDRPQT